MATALPASLAAHRPSAVYVSLIASTAALGGFLFGFDTAVINGAVVALQGHFVASDWMIGLAVSLALLGSAIGAFIAGPIADRFGRAPSMILAAVLFLVSAIGSGLPITIWDFIVWRTIGGVAVGMASVIAPAYIAEVSPAEMRGRLGSLQQLAIVVGIFVALLTNWVLARAAGGATGELALGYEAWRWMFWAEAIPAIVYGIGAMFIPESPRHLVAKGRDDEAAAVLGKLLPGDPRVKVAEIRESLHAEKPGRLSELKGPALGLLPIVWVGIGLSVLQQFVGINVIFYYSTLLWQSVGLSEENALLVTMITGVTNIVTTLIAIATVDKFGRRPLLLLGSIGMVVTLALMAIVFGTAGLNPEGQPELSRTGSLVALIAANAYVFCFGFSWGPVVWVLLGEMFSNRTRAIALSVAAAAQWVANFAVSTTFPPMASGLGLGASYAIYAAFALLSLLFVYRYVRETKGVELEQMPE